LGDSPEAGWFVERWRRSWSRSFGSMCGPTTATVPIELFGPQPPGVSARLTILDEAPGAVPCQDPLGSLLPADERHQRRHGPTCVHPGSAVDGHVTARGQPSLLVRGLLVVRIARRGVLEVDQGGDR
jgi:hypothetical protein